jgi:hypothetical protein
MRPQAGGMYGLFKRLPVDKWTKFFEGGHHGKTYRKGSRRYGRE